jgi:4'-phosphopantetheinyl transferase
VPNFAELLLVSLDCGTDRNYSVRWMMNVANWYPSQAEMDFLLGLLTQQQRDKALRFRFQADKKRSIISSILQLACAHKLMGIPWEDVRVERTKGGKPFCSNVAQSARSSDAPNFNYSVSHDGDLVVLASEDICICGVDISSPTTREIEPILTDLHSQLTAAEWAVVRSVGPAAAPMYSQFQRFWALKEAYLKAVGVGIAFEMHRLEFSYAAATGGIWGDSASLAVDGEPTQQWRFALQRYPPPTEEGTQAGLGVVAGEGEAASRLAHCEPAAGEEAWCRCHWLAVCKGPVTEVRV